MNFFEFHVRLPGWVEPFLRQSPQIFPTIEKRMRFVIQLSRLNVENRLGGPFGAAVFDAGGRLIAPGVNMVTAADCSILHAEMIALALAQKRLGRYDISDDGRFSFDLFASTEPCAMCFGAIPWSGVRRLVCGARDSDARAIGFDEGPKLTDWPAALAERGITVVRDVLREEAAAVHQAYAAAGGPVYNSGGRKPS